MEEREAAIFEGYTWREWDGLSRAERVHGVAHYRVHNLIHDHSEDAVMIQMERRNKRGQKGTV